MCTQDSSKDVPRLRDLYQNSSTKPAALSKFTWWKEKIHIDMSDIDGVPDTISCSAKQSGGGAARMVYTQEDGNKFAFKFNHLSYNDHNDDEWTCANQCPPWLIPQVFFL